MVPAVGLRALMVASAACLLPVMAQAQEAQPAPPAAPVANDAGTGNEIIVTASKREQTLQSLPVAVTVTTADTIQRAQIRDLKDLSTVVPSLRVSEHQSSAQTDFLIRGFGNGANNAGIEPSVGMFVDGVYLSRSAAQIADLPDLSRVEVLRGPQSTLFGKNASAGVVSIVTKEPQFKTGGSLEASYGRYNAFVLKSTITGKLNDHWAASLSSGTNHRAGHTHDGATGTDTNNRHRSFVRGQLLYKGDSGLKVRLIGDYGKIDEICCAVVNVQASGATAALQALGGKFNPASNPFGDIVYNSFDSRNVIENYGGSAQVDYPVGPIKLTSITAYRSSRLQTSQDSDFTSADLLGFNTQDLGIKTFTQELRIASDFSGPVNFLLGGYYFNEKINQTNQIGWGTQARSYANILINTVNSLPITTNSIGGLEAQLSPIAGRNLAGLFFGTGQGLDEAYHMADESISAFGQVDFHVTDRLTVTGGLNYTKDVKNFSAKVNSTDVFAGLDFTQLVTSAGIAQTVGGLIMAPGGFASAAQIQAFAGANPATYSAIAAGAAAAAAASPLQKLTPLQYFPQFVNVPNAQEPGRTSDGKLSWTARVAFDVTNKINVYASYSTGFKASSVNLSRDSRPAIAPLNFVPNLTLGSRYAGPETATLYEAGLKANWGLASVNIAVFKQSIKGFQSNLFTGTGFFLSNAGKESVAGFEFEGMVHPTSELTLSLALTYLDAKYDDFKLSPFGDVSGARVAGIAPLSTTIGASWDHPFDNGDHLILRGDWHYESPTQIEDGLPGFITTDPVTHKVTSTGYQDGINAARPFRREVSEVDASITYKMARGLEFSVWGRNLTNDRYLTVVFDSPAQKGAVSAYPNQPRTYGVSGLYKF